MCGPSRKSKQSNKDADSKHEKNIRTSCGRAFNFLCLFFKAPFRAFFAASAAELMQRASYARRHRCTHAGCNTSILIGYKNYPTRKPVKASQSLGGIWGINSEAFTYQESHAGGSNSCKGCILSKRFRATSFVKQQLETHL